LRTSLLYASALAPEPGALCSVIAAPEQDIRCALRMQEFP
jgi:hypothetical protein